MYGTTLQSAHTVESAARKTGGHAVSHWVFAFAEEKVDRVIFTLPRQRLLLMAFVLAALGVAFFHPAAVGGMAPAFRLFAVGGLIVAAVGLAVTALASEGELTIDGISRVVRLRLHTPWRYVAWIKPFDAFQCIQFYQVLDSHGFHNHWRIELVLDDGSFIRLGYGLVGAVRRSAADALMQRVAAVTGLPIRQLEK